ncbi:hypothetical protein OY671_007428, partial [Metschnikowia pulcherrima]
RVSRDGRSVAVVSPVSGRITSAPANLGQFVAAETESFRVADPRRSQITASIPPADAGRVRTGDRVELTVSDGRTIEGRVRSATGVIDPQSRAATVVIEPKGDAGLLAPGQLVQARIFASGGAVKDGVMVPQDAVQTIGDRTVVFVRTRDGFKAQTVQAGSRSGGLVAIVSGLKAGTPIATTNAFSSKAELEKEGRWFVAFLVLIIVGIGAWQITKSPIDAVPDVTNRQVQINTFNPTLGPVDMEKQVTFPVETALAGIPGLTSTRSSTRNGFSQVTAVFTDDTNIYFARQQVTERLAQARDSSPAGVQPNSAPLSTGLGEIFFYSVAFRHPDGKGVKIENGKPGWQSDGSYLTPEGEKSTTELAKAAYSRTVQDWIIRPQMRTVQGVAGVDSNGGYVKQYLVQPNLNASASYGLSITESADSSERANLSAGSNYIRRAGESFLVRADARLKSIQDIEEAVVATRAGVPVRVKDVGHVEIGGAVRTGSGSRMGSEAVISTVSMSTGSNSRIVATSAADKLTEINRALPPDVFAEPVYNRSKLVNATIATVEKNLVEGALLVIVVSFSSSGNIRAALITAAVIPITMLMTATGMNSLGVSGNLMSLGALDFGLIVDGAVIIVENALRRLAERQEHEGRLLTRSERMEETTLAAQEMIRPTVYGQLIIFSVFVPSLTFQAVEGKTSAPMAIPSMVALAPAFVSSSTFVPAMIALVITGKVSETEVQPIRWLKEKYAPTSTKAVAHP